jgi:Mg-chelatase subunit ChlD/anti-sigma factor RsiW
MNPEMPQKPQDELESSLTALLLGELPHEQAAALHQKLAQDADLAKLYERLKHTINLVRETVASPAAETAAPPVPLKLSDQRRQKLVQHFKTVAPKEFVQPRRRAMSWLVPVGIAAALVVIIGSVALPRFTNRTRSMGALGWGDTRAAGGEQHAQLVHPVLPRAGRSEDSRNLDRRVDRLGIGVQQPSGGTPIAPSLQQALPAAKPAGTQQGEAALRLRFAKSPSQIILPQSSELADSATTSAAEGVQPGFAVSATTRGFYDDSPGRSGGMGGGGGFGGGGLGGSGGGVRGDALATTSGQKGPAAAVKGFTIYAYGTPLQSPAVADNSSHTLEYKADGIVPTVGPDGQPLPSAPQSQDFASLRRYGLRPEVAKGSGTSTGASSPARQYPNNSTIGDAYFSMDPETRRVANIEAPPPMAVPPPSAMAAPAKPALLAQSAVVARAPMQALADNKVAGDLTARLLTFAPSQPAPDVNKAGEVLLKSGVAELDSANKLADAGASARKTTGFFDLQNADPQDVYNNLQDLFKRNSVRAQNNDQKALGFDSHAGNALVSNGRLGGQDGTAASGTDPALILGQEHMPPSEPAAAPNGTVPLAIKLPAAAFKGMPADVPVLGDVPVAGRLYRPTPGAAVTVAEADSSVVSPGQMNDKVLTWGIEPSQPEGRAKTKALADHDGELVKRASEGEAGKPVSRGANVYSLGVAGYVNAPITVTNAIAGFPAEPSTTERYTYYRKLSEMSTDASGASRPVRSPIVLPGVSPETSLTLNEADARDKQQRAAGAMQLKVEEKPKSVDLLAKLDTAASGVEKLHEEFQVANSTAAPNAPKKGATTEALGRLERQRTEGELKKESDDGNKVGPTAPAPVPQPEVQTADNAFSTFSLNVSDVSFKLAAASLEKGVMPEPATVRSEEFINAFDYRDPEPPPGVPVAFAWERAQYPFAQNRDLLRFSIKTAALGRQPGRPLNIVLLLDNSGSMERADRLRIIHEALRVLAGQLQAQDKLSVVTFARTAHLWVDGVPGNQAAQVAEEVSGLTPEGGTNLEDALNLAYQTALRHYLANGVNRVVLLTDGAANLGDVEPEALKQKVEGNRKQGIALDCFGIGWEGYNDDLLEVLSRNGDGRYAFLNSPEEVASEFAAKLAGALQVAASDVKVQVEFNPARVTAYRQIGYAKHQLTKEQFRDNTVNAAQIGAAEAGNALYTVEVTPAGTGSLCTVRVRFRIPGTTDYREHAWDVPFTGNAVPLEQASPGMRLAATGSAFSEWLASNPYAGEVTPDRLLSYLSGVPEVYGADARPKKLEWMLRQAKSITGK